MVLVDMLDVVPAVTIVVTVDDREVEEIGGWTTRGWENLVCTSLTFVSGSLSDLVLDSSPVEALRVGLVTSSLLNKKGWH